MYASYDSAIDEHYAAVAAQDGDRPSSTMADEITRRLETEIIVEFVRDVCAGSAFLCDAGCGNGFTLRVLAQRFPRLRLLGIEKSAALREIAESSTQNSVTIRAADIREPGFCEGADILICQRVLINLLALDHQRRALDNLVGAVRPGGVLLFVEAFASGLDRLNAGRAEFNLAPIAPAAHNLYLPDNFFDHSRLSRTAARRGRSGRTTYRRTTM